jgi:hypothetical protein
MANQDSVMTRNHVGFCVVAALGAGCGTVGQTSGRIDGMSDAAYRQVFTEVIGRTLADAKKDNVCIPALSFANPAIDVALDAESNPSPAVQQTRFVQLRALEAVGMVTRNDGTREVNGRTQHIASFRVSDQARPYLVDHALCYARATLDNVVKWKGPIALGDYRAAFVYYTTKIGPLADWARAPEIVAAFPTIALNVKNGTPKTRQVVIDKSSEGWDVAEYSKLLQLD